MTRENFTIAILVAAVVFMELLDATVINTSIPQMALSLGVSAISLKTAITSYLIVIAIFTPISSWMADKFGIKRVLSIAIIVFTLSSIACGLSTTITELSICRACQALGGAMMAPVARLLIIRTFKPSELVNAMSYVTIPALLGPVLGPLLGGAITTYLSWHWIFFLNVPIGIIIYFLIQKHIKEYISPTKVRFDKLGFVLIGIALAGLNFSLESLSDTHISTSFRSEIFIISSICLIMYIFHALKSDAPVLNLHLLKNRMFRVSIMQMILTIVAMGGVSFILAIVLQKQYGLNPLQSGMLTFPIALGALVCKPFINKIINIANYKKILTYTPLIVASGILGFTFIRPTLSPALVVIVGFYFGVWFSLQMSVMFAGAFATIETTQKGQASSFASTTQQFSMALSIGLSALLMSHFLGNFKLGSPQDTLQVISAFRYCMIILAGICIISSLCATQLDRNDGITHS